MNEENLTSVSEDSRLIIDENEMKSTWYEESDDRESADQDEADQPEPDWQQAEPETSENSDAEKDPSSQEVFRLKHLGQEIEATRDEVITLAQKGKDYDRIRGKVDELSGTLKKNSGYVSFLNELASAQGLSVDELMDHTKASLISKKSGIDEKTAAAQLRLERRENSLKTKEASVAKSEAAQKEKEKRNREIHEFLGEYKDIDPTTIPKEVWRDVAGGKTLLAAYTRHENKKLKAQMEAEKKNKENRSKSAGSQASAGLFRGHNEIEDDWYKDD